MATKPTIEEMKKMIQSSGTVNLGDSIQSLLDKANAQAQQGGPSIQGYVLVSEDYVLVTAPSVEQ